MLTNFRECKNCGKRNRTVTVKTGLCCYCSRIEVSEATCSRCGQTKPAEAFHKSPKALNGLTRDCIECRSVPTPESKTCGLCEQTKPATAFHRNRNARDGLQANCIECRRPKVNSLARRLAKRYGISPGDFERMLAAQGGCCPICSRKLGGDVRPHIDHCHATGVVRGVLCGNCNQGLGNFSDSLNRLISAAAYLAKSRKEQKGGV